jgi:hypothetical protein
MFASIQICKFWSNPCFILKNQRKSLSNSLFKIVIKWEFGQSKKNDYLGILLLGSAEIDCPIPVSCPPSLLTHLHTARSIHPSISLIILERNIIPHFTSIVLTNDLGKLIGWVYCSMHGCGTQEGGRDIGVGRSSSAEPNSRILI